MDHDINVKEPFKKFCIDEYFKDNTYVKYLSVFEKAKYEFAVYNLNPSADKYCKNLKNPKTGLIGVNELDLVSEFIGEDYDRLYQIIAYNLPMKPMALNFILKGW